MTQRFDVDEFRRLAQADRELRYAARGLSTLVRLGIGEQMFDITFDDGVVSEVATAGDGEPGVILSAPEEWWQEVFTPGLPKVEYAGFTAASMHGLNAEGDFLAIRAPYNLALQRLYQVVRASVVGWPERRPSSNPFKATDTAVGRYIYIAANGVESRIYYETAGTGDTPLLLQATAGTDSRQYRYLLADPAMQERFTMYAYDLPFHGKSLPPEGVRWWEEPYLPTREYLMNWVVGIADELGLDQPFFMGTSVGGQLALDLAAEYGDRFGGFIAVNGWYDMPPVKLDNNLFRTPAVSPELFPALCFGSTAPNAPEDTAHEVYFVYRSNYAGVYAGDNDYFMTGHDLKENGHKIDALTKPVFVVTGEYDHASQDEKHGGPAVERNIPGARFILAEGIGHFAPSDDPVAFGEFIVPVLDEALAYAAAGKERASSAEVAR
ncbi:alpha/beta hydrolase [Streptomyces sp. JV176]|uniref:alpha/beta fold hydrolase n=1 Tax=Streptomyces sp. JV176 TaxID=858630 RepID=UPI002E7A2A00|nr:alpha/beta hydrolase [Streptomyces sp. JV176]MEE1799498.1 alpha/beta hydrolase [Streptomyces sp. JV176]